MEREVRTRVVGDGVELDVPDRPRGALRIESDGARLLRVAIGDRTVAWARVLPWWAGVAWARTSTEPLALVPPIRASEARATRSWSARFGEHVADALPSGTWRLASLPSPDGIPPRARDLAHALDAPAAFVERYGLSGSGRVVALRDASPPGSARVKSWRKHARDGTLPPILLAWIAALDVYLVLDGHDRLRAAELEGTTPTLVGLCPLREDVLVWTEADRAQAREAALARYAHVFASEPRLSDRTRLEANQRLMGAWSDHPFRRTSTPARYRHDLRERAARELDDVGLPNDVRAVLLGD